MASITGGVPFTAGVTFVAIRTGRSNVLRFECTGPDGLRRAAKNDVDPAGLCRAGRMWEGHRPSR